MIPKEKVIAGAAMYIGREVLPHLPELKALAVAGVVDVDTLYNAFAPNITKPVEISIPLVGSLSFDRAEADKLLRYIKEA